MANIYVGFHDQRNSSRVLKPPGGGTSDIFGTDPPKISKNNKEAVSSPAKNETDIITKPSSEANDEIFNEENSKNGHCAENVDQEENVNNLSKSDSEEPNIENLNITEESEENIEESQINTKIEVKPIGVTPESISSIIQQQPQQEKQINEQEKPEKRTNNRVPPGGYSSGLW